jgi:hypothetical protein
MATLKGRRRRRDHASRINPVRASATRGLRLEDHHGQRLVEADPPDSAAIRAGASRCST